MQVLGKIFSRSAVQPFSRSAAQPLSRSAALTSIAFALLTACTAAAIGSTGYGLVFKGCSAANVAEYYDKTECVRDNATGLIWQGQTPAGTGLRANDVYKTNYDSTTELQKYGVTTSVFVAPTAAEINATTNKHRLQKRGQRHQPTRLRCMAFADQGRTVRYCQNHRSTYY